MDRNRTFDVIKRMMALMLCALISVAYIPVGGLGIAAEGSRAYANGNEGQGGEKQDIEDYNREWDRTMLIYWDGLIEKEGRVYVENDSYPYGEWQIYKVTDVDVIANNPGSGDPEDQVVLISREYEDEEETSLVGWRYEARKLGTAKIQVSYKDIHDNDQTYEFTVTVADDVYEVYLDSATGSNMALPGESLTVIADFAHARKNYEEEGGEMIPTGDSWDDNSDGMSFSWKLLDDGEDYASLQAAGDGKSAKVTFIDPIPNDEDWRDIVVKCTVTDDDSGDVFAVEEIRLTVANGYQELRPLIIDLSEVGDSATVKPELVIREKGKPDYAVPIVTYRWEYDENMISVSDPDAGGKYTITRIAQGDDETTLRLYADWTTLEGDDLTEEREYIFWSRGYDFHFDNYDWDTIYSDGDRILGLVADDDNLDLSSDDYSIAYTVGTGDYNDEDEFEFDTEYSEGTEYTVSQDRTKITLIGAKLFERGEGPIYVRAELKKNDYVLGSCAEELQVLDTLMWVDGAHDRDMLPGWEENIREEQAHIYTTELEGDFDYEITGAQIKSQSPKETGKDVIKLTKIGNDDEPYQIRALNYGSAVVEVSYKAVDYRKNEVTGEDEEITVYSDKFTFTVNVSDVVWRVNIDNDGSDMTLPGGSVDLHAYFGKDTEKDGWQPVEEDDLIFDWYLGEWEAGRASIEADPDHPSKATFTVDDDLDVDEQYVFYLHLAIYDKDDTEKTNKLCESSRCIEVRNSYNELWPVKIDGNMNVGETKVVNPEVRDYPGETEEYDVITGVRYTWYFDSDDFEISYNDEPVVSGEEVDVDDPRGFEIKRISNSESTINLQADWEEGHLERDYDFWEQHYGVWFEDAVPWVVFTDGSKSLTANIDGFEDYEDAQTAGYSLEFEAGFGYDFENKSWEKQLAKDTEYSVSGNLVTIDGTKLDPDDDEQDVMIIARLKSGEEVLTEKDCRVYFKTAREDYNLPQDRSLLPGWDGWINSENNDVWVENTAHPQGENLKFKITDVEIVSQNPHDPAATPVVELEEPNDNGDWRYVARNHGNTTIKVSYKDIKDNVRYATFNVYVGSDVYDVNVETADGTDRARPGDSVTLIADSWHKQWTQEGDKDVSTDGVTYDWQEDAFNAANGDYVTLTPDADDGSKAVLKFNDLDDMPEDIRNGGWRNFRVEVVLYDETDEHGDPIERARNDIWIDLSNEFYNVAPYTIDRKQQLGATQVIEAELRKFPGEGDDEYSIVNNAHFRWYYDPEGIAITDAEGKAVGNNQEGTNNYIDSEASYGSQVEFNIKRLRNGNERFTVCVDAQDDNGDWYEVDRRDYWLDELDYNIQFNEGNIDADCSDATPSVTLDKREVVPNDELTIEYEVGTRENDEWTEKLVAGEDYAVFDGLEIVTIDTNKVLAKDIHDVAVHASLKHKGVTLRENWAWIHIEGHDWDDEFTVDLEPKCTEPGSKSRHCKKCETVKDSETIAAKGHTEEEIPAVPATCTEGGKTSGKKCSVCGEILEAQEDVDKLGHKWKEATCTEPKTCERCHEKEGKPRGHEFGNWTRLDDKQHQRVCKHDGYVEKQNHTWQNGKCTVCGATQPKPATKPTGTVTILNTVANSAKKTNDVIWDKSAVKNATHYQIQWRESGKGWKNTTVGNVTRGTTTGLAIGGLYEIQVRPKNAVGYGAWSKSVYRYFHTTGKIRLASNSKGSFTMSWAKNPQATGYQVLYTTNKNGSGAAQNIKTAGAKATSITVSDIKVNGKTQKLKSGTTYYVQVRELKKVGTTTYIGNISCPVAVKVK